MTVILPANKKRGQVVILHSCCVCSIVVVSVVAVVIGIVLKNVVSTGGLFHTLSSGRGVLTTILAFIVNILSFRSLVPEIMALKWTAKY